MKALGRSVVVKSELIRCLLDLHPELTELQCRQLVETFFETMCDHLSKGGDIEIRRFGRFTAKPVRQETVRNPLTGFVSPAKPIFQTRFRAGKTFGALLNGSCV